MSVFKQFIQLRDKLAEHTEHSINALNLIANPGDDIDLDNFSVMPAFDDYSLKILDGELQLINKDGVVVDDIQYSNVKELDQYIPDTTVKWVELVDNVSNGAATYQLLSELMTKYSYSNRVSYSDIVNYIDQYDISDKTELYDTLFTATDNDGYISRPNFVAVIKQVFANAKNAADNDTYQLDTTNPYSLQVIMNILSDVVSATLNVICTALALTFNVIGLLIGSILSLVFQLIGKANTFELMDVDPLAITNYVKGPLIAIDGLQNYGTEDTYPASVTLTESNGLAIVTWPKNFDNLFDGLRVNAYLYPCWDGYKLIKHLLERNVLYVKQAGIDFDVSELDFDQVVVGDSGVISNLSQNIIYLDDKYKDGDVLNDKREIGLSLMIDHFIRSIRGYVLVYDSAPYNTFRVVLAGSPATGMTHTGKFWLNLGYIINYMYDHMGATKDDILSNCEMYIENGINAITDYVKNDIFPYRDRISTTNGNGQTDSCPVETGTHAGGWDWFPYLRSVLLGTLHNGLFTSGSGVRLKLVGSPAAIYDDTIVTDTVPTEFGISLPAFNADKVMSAIIALGVTSTVIAISSSLVKKMVTKKRYSKAALRADKLDKLREDYLNDPTNDQKKTAFQNAAYRYNKLGKWFGWGTYDAANGWIDSSVGTALTLSSFETDDNASINSNLTRIVKLIKP